MAEMASLHAVVQGRVQGVFFRASVEEQAKKLGLTGFVRNRPGNMVEVVAEGEKPGLEKLVAYLKIGPPAAIVKRVVTEWGEHTGHFPSFYIR
jgi:acylphosphatase